MDNEKAVESAGKYKSIPRYVIILVIIIIAILTYICISSNNRLQEYRYNLMQNAWEYNSSRCEFHAEYISKVFPKYVFSGGGGGGQRPDFYIFSFRNILNPSDVLEFKEPFFPDYQIVVDILPKEYNPEEIGIDYRRLAVQVKDIQPQQEAIELRDETAYMLMLELKRPPKDPALDSMGYWEGQGYVRLDEFRGDMFYIRNRHGIASPSNDVSSGTYSPVELQIWYGLAIVNGGDNDPIYGIDERSVTESVSAEQVAVENFRFIETQMYITVIEQNLHFSQAAYQIEQDGGYVRCLLLTGSGANIKEFIAYADAAGYIVEPLRVLDSE